MASIEKQRENVCERGGEGESANEDSVESQGFRFTHTRCCLLTSSALSEISRLAPLRSRCCLEL